jgi:hypothetical protein
MLGIACLVNALFIEKSDHGYFAFASGILKGKADYEHLPGHRATAGAVTVPVVTVSPLWLFRVARTAATATPAATAATIATIFTGKVRVAAWATVVDGGATLVLVDNRNCG